jgi:HEAT repeat protein
MSVSGVFGSNASTVADLGLLRGAIETALMARRPEAVPAGTRSSLRNGTLKKLKQTVLSVREGSPEPQMEAARTALQELGASGDPRAAEFLHEHFRQLPKMLSGPAAKALGDLGDPGSFDVLMNELVKQGATIHPAVLQALGALGDHRAARPLVLFGTVYPSHRLRAIDAAVTIGPTAVPTLIELAQDMSDPATQTAAIEVLGRLKDKRAVEALLPFVQHPIEEVRSLTAEALGHIEDKRAQQILCKILEDPSEKVRLTAVQALSAMPDRKVIRPMLRALRDASLEVRVTAIRTLGACNKPEAAEKLKPFLSSEHRPEVIAAAEALGRLGESQALPRLVHILKRLEPGDEDSLLRIIDAFRRLEDERAVLPLLTLLEHPSRTVRLRAIEALGKVGDTTARESLEQIVFSDPADDLRAAAAKALGEIGDPASLTALESAMRGPLNVRSQAIIAVGAIASPSALPVVVDAALDQAEQVRYHAATILGELGKGTDGEGAAPLALKTLERLYVDRVDMVSRAARRSLEALGDRRTDKQLRRAVKSKKSSALRASLFAQLMSLVPSSLIGLLPETGLGWAAIGSVVGVVVLGSFLLLNSGGLFQFVVGANIPFRGEVGGLSFSPDGRYLAGARTKNMLEIWDLKSDRVSLRLNQLPTGDVAFGADSQRLLSADNQGAAIASLKENAEGSHITPLDTKGIFGIAMSADLKKSATWDAQGLVTIWNMESAAGESAIALPTQNVTAFTISPDGAWVVAGQEDGSVRFWSTTSGSEGARFAGPKEKILKLRFSPDGTLLAGCGSGGSIIIWQVDKPPKPVQVLHESPVPAVDVQFPDTKQVIVARADLVESWSLATEQKAEFAVDLEDVNSLAVSPDGQMIAVGSREASGIYVYSSAGAPLKVLDLE